MLGQILMKQIEQRGFSAAANTGNDFHKVNILVLDKLIQVLRAIDKFSHNPPPDFLIFIIPEILEKSIVSDLKV